ncbi:GNAT family N-acetyltransferase [Alkalihalobacterium chitinilyticum]|uniref:GNAT family N-acetyltransferase n=1 Tax=Alkalihalobacterium chitinilyticum TaxID=2980103 RepID=A0ABT5VJL7_9BACI|nr:GNAT family N-acetyltransferase [Alkalihalobacterium chitinilyticum]MDE5415641.1 GNAT family N-acetyltransferase [Alkalihalobacterium chitinilyticum]
MILKLDITEPQFATGIYDLQKKAYEVEANIIGYLDLPPLKETVQDLQQCGELFLGYVIEEKVVGAISYKTSADLLDIHRLMVHPLHFRKGIAQALLTHLEECEATFREWIVSTGTGNTPAINFYKRNGFQVLNEVKVDERLSITNLKRMAEK